MAFQLSPGVLVTEKDLSLLVPSISTTAGGFAGAFQWGPANQVTTIDSEAVLVTTFGKPNDNTFNSFFTAANFLSYGNNLQIVRSVNKATVVNAVANTSAQAATAVLVENDDDYIANHYTGSGNANFFARYPGVLGNSLQVSLCDANTFTSWTYKTQFDDAPNTSPYVNSVGGSNDELHLVVVDEDGLWTGTKGTILEKYSFLSKASDAKLADGTSNYYKKVLEERSQYILWASHTSNVVGTSNWGSTSVTAFANTTNVANVTASFSGATDAENPTEGNIQTSYDFFANDELIDVSLLPMGAVSATTVSYVINNIAEVRRDCIVFASPNSANVINNVGSEASAVVNFRNNLPSTSFAVLDSGWKYQYDRYNDVYRYVPLSGDTAGCAVRTDFVADPWFSPAGFNRGQIKNVVKLAFSPGRTDRDTLYKKGINPVVTFPGNGTVLFGDKTLLAKPSAFDRINVRRLFIVLEKSIATAAKFQLFEFNDAFTQAQFRNLVEPFLRDVQGRRGITDFKVVCDETNNTGEVVDRNEFVADIFIKPARAINFIQLNFVATRTGISFEEVGV